MPVPRWLRPLAARLCGRRRITPRLSDRLRLECLEERLTPTVQVTWHGDQNGVLFPGVLTQVQVNVIFLGSQWSTNATLARDAQQLTQFYTNMITGNAYLGMLSAYNVDNGPQSFFAPDYAAYTGLTISDVPIRNVIANEISSNRTGPPTSQSLYFVYLAPNIQDTDEQLVQGGFGGYHWNFGVPTGPGTGQGVSYAVVPFPVSYVNKPGDPNVLADQTIYSSHELSEAVTNVRLGFANFTQDVGTGWWDPVSVAEIGDLCEGPNLKVGMFKGFWVQAEWSNTPDATGDHRTLPPGTTNVWATGNGNGVFPAGFNLSSEIDPTGPDRPSVTAAAFTTGAGNTLSRTATSGLLAGATDPNNLPLDATLIDGPQHGQLTLNPDGSFTYVPDTGYVGTDSFDLVASDGVFQSDVTAVSITVAPDPAVTGVSPPSGPAAGGTTVTITGTDFGGATAVRFGATFAVGFTVNSDTSIAATAPPGTAGAVDIVVTTAGGTSAATTADRFTYTGSSVGPAGDLAELNAAVWVASADGAGATASVQDDTTRVVAGQASLAFHTTGAFDTSIRYNVPADGWDVTGFDHLHAAFYAQNTNANGFQNGSPWVRLIDTAGNYAQYQYYQGGNPADVLNDAIGSWQRYDIPLSAGATTTDGWRETVSGTPDLTHVAALEIHADTWGFDGFTLWVDDLGFRAAPVSVGPASLPAGQVGTAYSQAITASGPPGPYKFTVSSGGLPPGLTLSNSGSLAGTPTAAGTFAFTVTAANSALASGSDVYTLTINPSPAVVKPPYAVGSGPGMPATVNVYNADGSLRFTLAPYGDFRGGVRVAIGDVNGDGEPDIITGAGPGGGPHIKVFSGADGSLLDSFFAYDASFSAGVFVAAGDVNAHGHADIITGAGAGGGPHVKVFDGETGAAFMSFFAYDASFHGGVTVAAGDVDGDGKADIITGAGAGGGPHVKVFSGADGSTLRSFFAYDASFTGGVFVAAGDVNGDGKADIITGAGAGGGPHVKVFSGADSSLLTSFFAYDAGFSGGVTVGTADVNGDGHADIVTGAGPRGGPHLKVFDGKSLATLENTFSFDPTFVGGVFVG
jgi:hypothetical protein